MSDDTFDISFSLCVIASESCKLNDWSGPPTGWIEPQDLNIFLDGVPGSTSFSYTNWYDDLSLICSVGFCGTISFDFVTFENTSVIMNIDSASVVTTDASEVKTITVSTTSLASAGSHRVSIVGKLSGTNAFGIQADWGYFTIQVVDPCT